MSLWKNDRPPVLYQDAVATPAGWADPVTGELLVTVTGLSTFKGGASELNRVHIVGTKKIFADDDYIVIEADFTEPVTITGTPTIAATINGNARTFTYFVDNTDLKTDGDPANGTGTNKIRFRYQVVEDEIATANQITFTSPMTATIGDVESAQGTGAAGTAVTSSGVTSATVDTVGSGYTSAPTVVFTGGTPTTAATAIAVLDKQVASITITAGGTLYTSAPTVGFSGGAGTGAAGTAVLAASGVVKSVTVGGTGTGYTDGDALIFTGGGGTGAAGTITVVGGNITAVTMSNNGSGYTSAPTVTVTTAGGSSNTLTAVLGKAVASVTITNGGTGYTSAPTVAFTSGGGSGAAGTAVLSNLQTVKSITITSPGVGYNSTPTISFTGGAGTGAAATAVRSNVVASVTMTAGGTKYWTAPTVGFSGGSGSGAAGTATIDRGVVTGVTITDPGSGYSGVPTVAFTPVAEAPNKTFPTSGISTGFSVDAVHPTITGVVLSGASVTNHFYTNDFITFTVTCDKVMYVTGSPYITVNIDGVARQALYYQGSKSATLVFRYEVVGADVALATEVTRDSPIVLNSGTITDYQGNPLTLTFTGPTMTAQIVN